MAILFLHDLTIKKVRGLLLSKELSAFELTKEFLKFTEKKDKTIGAYVNIFHDAALEQANAVDVKIAKEENVGALAGVPLAIKDNILVRDFPTTAGSKILEHYRAAYNATVVDKLAAEDAVFLGKTNLDEFAMGVSTESSAFQVTRNPRDTERVPGGSSGGSAAAVSGNMAVAALGSDTGGSIRQPTGFCGLVGLRPTYGAVSRYGLIAMASSLDQIGPITKTVEDAATLFQAIAGKDSNDATTITTSFVDTAALLDSNCVKNLKVGLPKEYFEHALHPHTHAALEKAITSIKSIGVSIKKISLPHTKYAVACYYVIVPAEVSSNLARFDGIRYGRGIQIKNKGSSSKTSSSLTEKIKKLESIYFETRAHGFGAEPARRIILGTFVLSSGYYDAYYAKAQKVRALIKQDFDTAFENVDVILAPVSPAPAFKIGEKTDDPLSLYLEDIFTTPASLAGIPAVTIPVHNLETGALPVGFQLIGRRFHEEDILGLGIYYDKLYGL